jgi:hypothetical protein
MNTQGAIAVRELCYRIYQINMPCLVASNISPRHRQYAGWQADMVHAVSRGATLVSKICWSGRRIASWAMRSNASDE